MRIRAEGLASLVGELRRGSERRGVMERVTTRLDGNTLVVRIPMRFKRRGGRKRIVAPDGSEHRARVEAAAGRHASSRRSRARGGGSDAR